MSQVFNLEPKVQIVVAFLSSRKLDANEIADEDDEDDEDDDEFDFSPTALKTKLPGKRIVEMKILKTGAKVHVKCRLPWTWSWLQATLELRFPVTPRSSEVQQLIDGKFKVVQCHLDPSIGHNGVYAISLFLKDVRANDLGDGDSGSNDGGANYYTEYKTQFCNWLERQTPHTVRLVLLEKLLTKYEEEQQELRGVQTGLFRQLMSRSVAGQVFCLATNQPTFFRAAPILFPKKIMSIMVFPEDGEQEIRRKQKLLEALEDVAKEEPWKFGFGDMMYKETKYSGLEAPYFAVKNAWFYSSFSDLHKTALQTYDLFKQTCKSRGHTFLLQHDLPTHFHFHTRDINSRAKDGEETAVPSSGMMNSATEFLIENEVLKREVKGAEERFHLMRYWKAEESICSSLESVLLSPSWELDVDMTDPKFERIQADGAQMAAARGIIGQPVTLISGRGGTGKTEVVSAVLKAAEEGIKKEGAKDIEDDSIISEDGVNSEDSYMTRDKDTSVDGGGGGGIEEPPDPSNGPILYCAPTGKAASVIKKRVGSKAFTIHQILASYKLWRSGEQTNPWKFAATRVVAVDECSMVSIEIFQFLLKYLIEGSRLAKVVLLGDHLQLPSVDPGNFMEDLYIALKPRGLTVNLATNHRSEGSIIFSNATKISNQQMPIFDTHQGFSLIVPDSEKLHNLPPAVRKSAKKLSPPSAPPPQTVKGKGREPDMDRMLLYWALLRQYKEQYKVVDDEKSQIISFLNNECTVLNQFGCFVYNKHLVWEGDGRKMRKQFHVGDKIICTKNSDVPIYVEDEKEENVEKAEEDKSNKTKALEYTVATDGNYEEPPGLNLKTKNERLMNGNLYKIRAVCRGDVTSSGNAEDEAGDDNAVVAASEGVKVSREYYVLDDLSGDIIRASPDMLVKKTKITHAWALSIHKFQGSEADTIVYGLSGSNYESWKHVYTAVTRGRKNVVIVGRYQDLEKAVKKKPIRRQTALTEKVRKLMGTVAKKKEEMKAAQKEEVIPDCDKTSSLTQPKLDPWVKKVTSNSKPFNLESSLTPTKLSQMFSDSMRDWETQDTLFEEVKAGRGDIELSDDSDIDVFSDTAPDPNITEDLISPGKRKANSSARFISPKQIKPLRTSSTLASRNLSQSKAWNLDESTFQADLLRSKRPACDSPASYQSTCKFNSPLTYGVNRSQPQPGTPQWGEDSFSELNCSQLETEAIASSQQVEARKNMVDVFGSDESDDALDNLDEDSDDELAQAVKMSQLETNREEMEINEVLALSQKIY